MIGAELHGRLPSVVTETYCAVTCASSFKFAEIIVGAKEELENLVGFIIKIDILKLLRVEYACNIIAINNGYFNV